MKSKRMGVTVGLATLLLAAGARAEDGWVKRSAVLRAEQSPAGDQVMNVFKGAKVSVLAREGAWVRVNADGKAGWLAAETVSAREIRPDLAAGGLGGGATLGAGAAARGLQPKAEEYARGRNLDPAGLTEMQRIRAGIDGKMLKSFIADGGIAAPK